jgi:hypothetical protein
MYSKPEDLIGTVHNPPGFDAARAYSRQSKAYFGLQPYPRWSPMTKDWKIETRGPLPRCQPFVRRLIQKGAVWLFGKPLTFRAASDHTLSAALNDTWAAASMGSRAVSLGAIGGLSGGVVLKFSFDPKKSDLPSISVLDPGEQTRLYWDAFDCNKLLMARVQFPYIDPTSGRKFWYREDWTDSLHVTYKPFEDSGAFSTHDTIYENANIADKNSGWQVEKSTPNPFGIIPLWYIQNRNSGADIGEGDLWQYFHIIDQINFTIDLAHKHNQKHISPDKAYIDLQPPVSDPAMSGAPIESEVLETIEGKPSQGKVQVLETDGSMRPHIKQFLDDLLRDLFQTIGMVDVSPDSITNKGNLTASVLTQLYAPLIETTSLKRGSYGEDGIAVFMERMSTGMANLGVKPWKSGVDVQIVWPPMIQESEDEKTARTARKTAEVAAGFDTPIRAAREILTQNNGVIDVDDVLTQLPQADPSSPNDGEETNGTDTTSTTRRKQAKKLA